MQEIVKTIWFGYFIVISIYYVYVWINAFTILDKKDRFVLFLPFWHLFPREYPRELSKQCYIVNWGYAILLALMFYVFDFSQSQLC